MADQSLAIRLALTDGGKVKAELVDIGASGQRALERSASLPAPIATDVAPRLTVSVFVPSLLETTNSRLIAGTVRSRATLRFVARKAIDPRNCASVSVTLPAVKSTESWPHSAASSASNASLAVTSFCACELTMWVMLRLGVAMR